MKTPLPTVARHLEVPERSMRRAAKQGLVKGERQSLRKFLIPVEEEDYLRRHWGLLSNLRQALRTEPNVSLAVLFGSVSRGTGNSTSDIDLMVDALDRSSRRLGQLRDRLQKKMDRDVQIVEKSDAERSPALMVSVIEDGRVLVDRRNQWWVLVGSLGTWRAKEDSDGLAMIASQWSDGS